MATTRATATALRGAGQSLQRWAAGGEGGERLMVEDRGGGGGGVAGTARNSVRAAGGDEGEQEEEEGRVGAPGDTHVEPDAVVIKVAHAPVAYAAVLGMRLHIAAAKCEAAGARVEAAGAHLHHWQNNWHSDLSFGCAFQRGSRMSAKVQYTPATNATQKPPCHTAASTVDACPAALIGHMMSQNAA